MEEKVILVEQVVVKESYPPSKYNDFIKWIQNKYLSIPDEFRESAKVEIEKEYDDDDSVYANIVLRYLRPENSDEKKRREAEEQIQRSVRAAQYEALKKEFG